MPEPNEFQKPPVDQGSKTPANLNSPQSDLPDDGYLKLLNNALWTPGLSLLTRYLASKNGSRKTAENCVTEFAKRHPRWFKCIFAFDLFWRLVYLLIVLIVALRGLGILDLLSEGFSRFIGLFF